MLHIVTGRCPICSDMQECVNELMDGARCQLEKSTAAHPLAGRCANANRTRSPYSLAGILPTL